MTLHFHVIDVSLARAGTQIDDRQSLTIGSFLNITITGDGQTEQPHRGRMMQHISLTLHKEGKLFTMLY
jgi:hypothetical protein